MKYKKLKQSDIIQKGDEYKTSWGSWAPIEPEFIGKRKGAVLGWYIKMRCLLEITTKDSGAETK